MPKLVPSEVVLAIKQIHEGMTKGGKRRLYSPVDAPYVRGILEMIESIPEYLLPSGANLTSFMMAMAAIRERCDAWSNGDTRFLLPLSELGGPDPVELLRDILDKCPDESPAHASSNLLFIKDDDLRRNLQQDLSSVNEALSNGEWKGATVLAGALCEALLLYKLQECISEAEVRSSAGIHRKDLTDIETWHLPDYIKVSETAKKIKEETAKQLTLAKDFRNLIHPGKVSRTGQKCDRGTALATVAAVELVIRDLTP